MLEAPAVAARHGKWLLCFSIAIVALALTFWPQGLLQFRYERLALAQGEVWRLASAHLAHVSGRHLLLNVAGLLLLCELLWDRLPLRHGIGLLMVSAAGIDALLWWFHPELDWYAGLSGVLHGLWAGCALALCWQVSCRAGDDIPPTSSKSRQIPLAPAWIGGAGVVLLIVKLAAETLDGHALGLAHTIGAPVIGIAHLYGALLGAIYIIAWRGWQIWHRNA